MTRRPWTPEALAEVCRRYPHERTADIARDLGRSIGSIHGQANMLGLKKTPEYMREIHGAHIADAGARYRFHAEQSPWNKGIPGSTGNHPNTKRTQFKPGRRPEEARNYQPIGTLRICKDGYLATQDHGRPGAVPVAPLGGGAQAGLGGGQRPHAQGLCRRVQARHGQHRPGHDHH